MIRGPVAWFPAQHLAGQARVGNQRGGIARAPSDLTDAHRVAGRPCRPTPPPARTEWPCPVPRFRRAPPPDLRAASPARARARRPDRRRGCSRGSRCRRASGSRCRRSAARAAPQRRLDRERDEVRLRIVILADLAVGIGAGGVEVAERRVAEAVRLPVPVQHLLDGELGLAVRVDRVLRVVLGDRHASAARRRSRTSTRTRRRARPRRSIASEQVQRPDDVVAEILAGVGDRLADVGVGGEVDHRVHAVALHDVHQQRAIGEIAAHQRSPLHRPLVSVHEVVEHDRVQAGRRHRFGGLTADVACAPTIRMTEHDSGICA